MSTKAVSTRLLNDMIRIVKPFEDIKGLYLDTFNKGIRPVIRHLPDMDKADIKGCLAKLLTIKEVCEVGNGWCFWEGTRRYKQLWLRGETVVSLSPLAWE